MNKVDFATGVREWYVVFEDRQEHAPPQWFHRIIPNKWAHVWAFTWHPDTGIYLTIDPRGNHLFVQPVPVQFHPHTIIDEIANRPKTRAIVHVQKDDHLFFVWLPHFIYTCVSVIKDLVGISAPFVITPNQLFKILIRGKKGMVLFIKSCKD